MRLKEIRIERGLSQNKLALLSGLSRQAIAFIEQGKKSPTLGTLQKLADALNVSVSMLISENQSDQKAI